MSSLADASRAGRSNSGRSDFQQVVASFLSQPGLPFAGILSAERIERIFARHGNVFGVGRIYSTAVMVWSFQVRGGGTASGSANTGPGRWPMAGHQPWRFSATTSRVPHCANSIR